MRGAGEKDPGPGGGHRVLCAVGFLTIFWSLLAQVNSVYILAHRVIWSLVFMGLYLVLARRWGEVKGAFRSRKTMLNCLLCGVLITVNWGCTSTR